MSKQDGRISLNPGSHESQSGKLSWYPRPKYSNPDEPVNAGPQPASMYFAEYLGTMALVMFVKLCSSSGDPNTPLAIGLGLAIMINNLGHISGAQYNPSVTIAVLVRNTADFPRSDKTRAALYFVMQFSGAIIGGLAAWLIDSDSSLVAFQFGCAVSNCVLHSGRLSDSVSVAEGLRCRHESRDVRARR